MLNRTDASLTDWEETAERYDPMIDRPIVTDIQTDRIDMRIGYLAMSKSGNNYTRIASQRLVPISSLDLSTDWRRVLETHGRENCHVSSQDNAYKLKLAEYAT